MNGNVWLELRQFYWKIFSIMNSVLKLWFTLLISGEFDDYEVQSKLEQEQAEYGDILQESFKDSYNNLTIKSIFILKYYVSVADNLGNKFLLKTDDDSFVHLEALWDLAKSRMSKKSNNLIGYLQVTFYKINHIRFPFEVSAICTHSALKGF